MARKGAEEEGKGDKDKNGMGAYKAVKRRDMGKESEGKVMGYGFKSEKLN